MREIVSPSSASAPLFTGLDCEFIQLSGEAARPFDAAADGALGGDPERASLFAFKQLVVVKVAAAPSEAAAARFVEVEVEVEVDVDRVPDADRVPDVFVMLGGAGGHGSRGSWASPPGRR